MQKLFSQSPLDILPCPGGFIFLLKEKSAIGRNIITFYRYSQAKGKAYRISKDEYLYEKFGKAFKDISDDLGNYISCKSAILKNGKVAVITNEGAFRFYSSGGDLLLLEVLEYQGAPLTCLSEYKSDFWSTVPDRDCVVCYSPTEGQVMLRVGGANSNTFSKPVCLYRLKDEILVCSKNDFKVRKLDLKTLLVSDYLTFDEPVSVYFEVEKFRYALLDSGLYLV